MFMLTLYVYVDFVWFMSRTAGLGMSSAVARVGGMVAPYSKILVRLFMFPLFVCCYHSARHHHCLTLPPSPEDEDGDDDDGDAYDCEDDGGGNEK